MHWPAPLVAVALLLLVALAGPGCLSPAPGPDLSQWQVGLTISRFEPKSQVSVNQSHFAFDVRLGPLQEEGWVISQSAGFKKGNESSFPFRVEALYGDFQRGPFRYGGEQVWVARRC